jgi:2,3-dihydroxybiphenyl 1,2-dioxygenase
VIDYEREGASTVSTHLHSLGYVGIETNAIDTLRETAERIFGFQLVDSSDDELYLRIDDRHHRIALRRSEADALAYLGWEVRNGLEFTQSVEHLRSKDVEVTLASAADCTERHVEQMAFFSDPAGFRHEIFYGMNVTFRSFVPGREHGGFVTGGSGLGHAVVAVPDAASMHDFLLNTLNFNLTDIVHGEYGTARFYHLNSRHHSLATLDIPGMVGLDHIMVEAAELDDVGIANDLVAARIEDVGDIFYRLSLGRHSTDRMTSIYIGTQSGFSLEYGWGGRMLDTSTWSVVGTEAHELWGHEMLSKELPATIRPGP